jgi:hypothetical protein
MHALSEIKRAIERLPQAELVRFRDWFNEFDRALWDRKFRADVSAGRLDTLAQHALNDLKAGRCTDL